MRLNINLATQPYEDARRFMMIWSAVLGVLLLLVLGLAIGVVRHWSSYRQMSSNINREQQILQDLNLKQQQDLAILNKPENKDVREKSDFINDLILRKQISWTTIFTNLEQLMPSHLRVIGIAPRLVDNRILLQVLLSGDSRDRAAELARRMEKSSVFRDAQIVSESHGESQTGQPGQMGQFEAMRFELEAEFLPSEAISTHAREGKSPQANSGAAGEGVQTAQNGGAH